MSADEKKPNDDLRKELCDLERAIFRRAMNDQFLRLGSKAIDALEHGLMSDDGRVRVKVACAILDRAMASFDDNESPDKENHG